jgi:hypothetical protein
MARGQAHTSRLALCGHECSVLEPLCHGASEIARFVYACRSLARAVMKGPTPEVIWVFSSAQNAGFHLVTRSHHASIHTLD